MYGTPDNRIPLPTGWSAGNELLPFLGDGHAHQREMTRPDRRENAAPEHVDGILVVQTRAETAS